MGGFFVFLIFIVKGFNIIPTMTKISKDTNYKRNCPNCTDVLYYNNTSSLNLAERKNKVCRSCAKLGTKTKKNHPELIKRICEWTGDVFYVEWKKRNARFKDKKSMYEWRKSQNHETVKCLNCGNKFDRYKNAIHPSTGLPQQYCSNECNRSSQRRKDNMSYLFTNGSNPMNNQVHVDKIKQTKLEKYGDAHYNNMEKTTSTNIERYGVLYATYLPQTQSNGTTISKGQRRLYEEIKKKHEDAMLEYYLPDIQKSVDIFIPSENRIVEYYGDYWHCNPKKYKKDYYHTQIHKTASEIWEFDNNRIQQLKDAGYMVDIIWEGDEK